MTDVWQLSDANALPGKLEERSRRFLNQMAH